MPRITANGIELEYAIRGEGEPLLLIMGLGAQMIRWPVALTDKLIARGFQVILFDNRDVGLSEKIDSAGAPDMAALLTALQAGQKPPVAYTLDEMAADAAGLLAALHIPRAHIAGASMGGMIAQMVAADYPERTLSLTSIMSTTGNRSLPPATPEAIAVLNERGPDPKDDLEGYLDHAVRGARTIGSPGYPAAEADLRAQARAYLERGYYPVGFSRQYAAIIASGDRRARLARITAPTVVLHGADDPLVPLAGGVDTAETIPGAELRVVPGMGHDIPEALYDTLVEAIAAAAARARAPA